MLRNAVVVLTAVFATSTGCGSDEASPDAATSRDASLDSTAESAACYPMGIYGSCVEGGCPMCLNGANIYSVCSAACTDDSQCGDPSELSGASPLCAPLNPGAADMICVVTCTSQEQCPCGLECRESGVQGVKICAETL